MIVGEVRKTDSHFLIDCDPHVMVRVRSFLNARSGGNGKRTHSMLEIEPTPPNAKDILWLHERFPLKFEPAALESLKQLASRYDRAIAAAQNAENQRTFDLSGQAYEMALPPREHQVTFRNLAREVGRLLLGDDIGMGKTISAITLLCEPSDRPALIVVPPHLCHQWRKQLGEFLPSASCHIIKGKKPYPLPNVDVYIIGYSCLIGWEDVLVPMACKTLVFDEVQELRHTTTVKRRVSRALSQVAQTCVGLSATPIYNMGGEIWSIMDVISPGALGTQAAFTREWCAHGDFVKDGVALHACLKAQGLMLRRVREPSELNKSIITLDADLQSLHEIQNVSRMLAMSVLRNVVGESENSARELDWKLRHATGVAKAKATAEFVKMLVASGEQVLLAGWHREVYDIWLRELKNCYPVMCTGSESPAEKARSQEAFVKGRAKVFICSLRSGVGIDGLQQVCNNIVFGELDWSPHVMNQLIGRLDREGQTKAVNAHYMTIDDGADPFMLECLAGKLGQHDQIVDGQVKEAEILADVGIRSDRIRAMAESYLLSIGESLPNAEPSSSFHVELTRQLRSVRLPASSERIFQEALAAILPSLCKPGAIIEREVRINERSRLDFLVTHGSDRIAIECKINQTGRPSVYRQVRRYIEEADITGAIIMAPWAGVNSFEIDGVPVTIADWTKANLLG